MSSQQPSPVLKRADEIDYETLSKGEHTRKGVLIDESDGAPNLAIRRYVLEPGADVPKHTNEVEHEVYTVSGEYVVGIGDEEHVVSAGDSLFIPAGVVHWFRNDTEEESSFICAVPNGDDSIRLVDES
jgi:quercetin dioxygenase-like cupin family protein